MNWESLFRPWYLVRRMAYKIHELRHPDEPWLAQGAVEFCSRILTREHAGLEWGSGRSTLWFGQRLRLLVSVEYDPAWHVQVEAKLRGEGLANVVCRYIPLDHDPREGTRPHYDPV